jgi:uncharacterized protein involved in outer membrane biogenesis
MQTDNRIKNSLFPEDKHSTSEINSEPQISPFRLIKIVVFSFLFIIFFLYVISSISAPFLKNKIQNHLEKFLNTDISIGNLEINPIRRSIVIKKLEVKNPFVFGEKIFFKTQEVTIRPAILPLLKKNFIILRIAIDNPQVNLHQTKDNSKNWDFIWQNKKIGSKDKKHIIPTNEILIKNGKIQYIHETENNKKPHAEIDGFFVHVKNYSHPLEYIKDTPLSTKIKARGHIPSNPKGNISFEINSNILEEKPSFHGTVSMDNISLTYFNDFYADTSTVEVINGTFSLLADAECLEGRINSEPNVTVNNLQLKLTNNYSTADIFKLPVMLVIEFFDIYKEEIKFSFKVSGTLDDPEFHIEEILKQEITSMISESIVNKITSTPSLANKLTEKLKALGTTIIEIGKGTGKSVSQIQKPIEEFIKGLKEDD